MSRSIYHNKYNTFINLDIITCLQSWTGNHVRKQKKHPPWPHCDLLRTQHPLEACLSAKFKTVERRLGLIENKSTTFTTSLASVILSRPALENKTDEEDDFVFRPQ
jgi:hypothetical protein